MRRSPAGTPPRLDTVDDLFAPPGTDWRPVSPQLARLRRTVAVVVSGLMIVVLVVAWLVFGFPVVFLVLGLLVLLVGAVLDWWLIGRNVASWGYAEREDDLYIRHGVMFRELVAVPYGRMQYVDVNAGPLEQAHGIARVHLHTASPGTSAVIPGLPRQEAARLRDRLTALGESQAAGL